MKRVKHRETHWDTLALVLLGVVIIAAGGFAVWMWFKNGGGF